MKIDIAEVPTIRNLLDKLLVDQHNLAHAETVDDALRITAETGIHMGDISKEELLSVYKARIDASLKTLNSKFYIEFKNSELPIPAFKNSELPIPAFKPTSVDGVDVTAVAEEGAQA